MFEVEVSGYGAVAPPGVPAQTYFCISVRSVIDGSTWVVYRRYANCFPLADHLRGVDQSVPPLPFFYEGIRDPHALNAAAAGLEQWLQTILQVPRLGDSALLRKFLCAEANMPPPYYQALGTSGKMPTESFGEMEMEDLFAKDDWQQRQSDFQARSEPSSPQSMLFEQRYTNSHLYEDTDDNKEDEDSFEEGCVGMEPSSVRLQPNGDLQEIFEGAQQASAAPRKATLDQFKPVRVVGKGSFGKVMLVRHQTTGTLYAMKVLKKEHIIQRNQVQHTLTERSVLGYVRHPYIVGLNMAFQTKDKLYFVLDYCSGGELFYHLGRVGRFPLPQAQFYAAEILLALEYIHSLGVIYRDLKPENVLLDADGHIRLTDFGLSKEGVTEVSSGAYSFCGTPEYIAPEILDRRGHGTAVDWWSFGTLLYEMIVGLPPFYSQDRKRLYEKIRSAELKFPAFMPPEGRDILTGLLQRDPNRRLGSGPDDAIPIKMHPFFADIDWPSMMRREVAPLWRPELVGSLDVSQFDKEFTTMPLSSPEVKSHLVSSVDDTFKGFTFTDQSVLMHQMQSQR